MWVNPNIVFPPGKLEVSQPRKGEGLTSILPSPPLPPKEEDCAHCSKVDAVELLPASSREQSPPRKQLPSSPSSSEVGVSGVAGGMDKGRMHRRVLVFRDHRVHGLRNWVGDQSR